MHPNLGSPRCNDLTREFNGLMTQWGKPSSL